MRVEIGQRIALPLRLLAAAGFLSSAGARVIDPLISVIAADFQVSVPAVSVVIAAFTLPYGLNQIVLGPVGDRYGKLRVLLGALVGYALATGGCALAGDLPQLTLLRSAAGAASAGLIPVGLAYIGDCVPYADRQVTLSRFLTGVVLAQMIAGPLGGVFGEYFGWRGVFMLLSLTALVVAGVLAARMPNLPDRRHDGMTFQRRNYSALFRFSAARVLLAATLVEGALMSGSFPFIAPYLHDAFGLAYATVGLTLACFGLGAFAYTQYARRWVNRFGERGLVVVGGAAMAGSLLLGIACPSWEAFILVEAMLGLGYFMLHTVLQARATELLPHARATAVSAFVFMLFLGQSLGALAMGGLIARFGYRGAFLIDAAGIITLALFLFWYTRRPAVAVAHA